jgi:hypothetical protein
MIKDMTANSRHPMHGSCDCGTCNFDTANPPKARFICHCTICQAFTGKPFSDVVVLRARDVVLKGGDHITFKKYKKYRLPPPNLNRGRCGQCGKPVVEATGFGPLKLMFIPSVNFAEPERLPRAQMHIFYDRRRQDAQDDLPKHEHYWPSQLAIGQMLMHKL